MTTVRRLAQTFCCFFLLLPVSGCGRAPKLTAQSPEALRAYQEGLGQYEKFYYREAKALFEEALRKDSTFAMAWTRMAMVNWVIRDEEQARRDITRAMQLAAHVTEREQLFIRTWSQILNFNTSGALATVDSLITRYPDEKEGYLLRGNLNENNKNLEAAKQSYQQAINVDTAYAQAVMSLGYIYSTTERPKKPRFRCRSTFGLRLKLPIPAKAMPIFSSALGGTMRRLSNTGNLWNSNRTTGMPFAKSGISMWPWGG